MSNPESSTNGAVASGQQAAGHGAPPESPAPATDNNGAANAKSPPARKRIAVGATAAIVLIAAAIPGVPWIVRSLRTVSTDDAYVNNHVTFVAPRVAGQVTRVLVDDNNRVRKGDLLVQIDKEPYQVQVNIAQAAVDAAKADLVATQAQVRALEGKARSARFKLEHGIEDVDNQVALLRAKVATLKSQRAVFSKAQADFDRAMPLANSGAVAHEELDRRKESLLIGQARVEEALQAVYQSRVSLGLPAEPSGGDLADVPANLDQTFSSVRQAQYELLQAASELGVTESFESSPREMIASFYKRDPEGRIDRIYDDLLKSAPSVKQSEAKLARVQRDLDQALLNLRYTDVFAEIDGVVTRREVNPGNNIVAGQSLMALRSLMDIWVDANFKETQLAELRIGQPVEIRADMYGGRRVFKGRISGFTNGTGSTLALLPPENATGNFVKVVQRLPVRIDLVDYDPDKLPLFVGLSVTPYVDIRATPTGPDAGNFLQPYLAPSSTGSVSRTSDSPERSAAVSKSEARP